MVNWQVKDRMKALREEMAQENAAHKAAVEQARNDPRTTFTLPMMTLDQGIEILDLLIKVADSSPGSDYKPTWAQYT